MSSPNHPTSDIEDAFSSNFLDYILASPDYVPASPGKTYSSSSNNSFGVVPIVSPTLLLFHDDPYMKELLSPKKQGHNQSFSSTFALPQEFKIGESSRKTSMERHEKQIEEIKSLGLLENTFHSFKSLKLILRDRSKLYIFLQTRSRVIFCVPYKFCDEVRCRNPQGGRIVVYLDSVLSLLLRFYTSAGNPVKEILLKLNLPDHRSILTDSKILKDGGEDFRYSDTVRLSRSDEVLKLKNFKKDATLKLSKSTNQEWYEHVGPEVTRSQDDKVTRWRNEIMLG
ncbi:hypothetical protein Tco_0685173 [Tanacetum coccineum]